MKKLFIGYDRGTESPRTFSDHYTKIFSCHRNATGDINATGGYESLRDEYLDKCGKDNIELPIYLYEHSGIAVNTTGFSCPWDSGKLGYIFAPKSVIREEFGWKRLTAERIERIETYMRNEVEEWGKWLNGEVYFYRIEDENGEIIASIGGLHGKESISEYLVADGHYNKVDVKAMVDEAFERIEC